jgi:uncharacterized protein YkwD
VFAEHADFSEMEIRLFEHINKARLNPLETAASFGMNPDAVLAGLPELHDVLVNGLPVLYYNENLKNSARAHKSDMLNNNYYNHISSDGRTPDDRIRAAGYIAGVTGESLGILGFVNFISPEEAADRIFENMFRDELDPERAERRNILASDVEEMGAGFGAGAFTIGGISYNAYAAVCDFGAGIDTQIQVPEWESILFQLINQARVNPLKMAADMGFDTQQLIREFPHMKRILVKGLPPLKFNPSLYNAAYIKVQTVLENHNAEVFDDSAGLYGRMITCGYVPAKQGEFYFISEYDAPEAAAWQMFERMFRAEFDDENRYILNPDFEDVGIVFGSGYVYKDGLVLNACIAVCDFAKDAVTLEEKELLRLVNQARSKPLEFAASLGLDTEKIMADLPEYHDVLINGLPPLVFNPYLRFAAEKHLYDMAEYNYYGHISLDGRNYEDRIRENGYEYFAAGEAMDIKCFNSEEGMFTQDAVFSMFKNIFVNELTSEGEKNILNRELTEAGIRFATVMQSGLSGVCGDSVYLTVMNFGKR